MGVLTALAPAKVNLFLHVGPTGPDGLHPLTSLVAFADVGDAVAVEPAERLSLTVRGPFAEGLSGDDNLILRALRALGQAAGIGEPGLRVTLDKRLPVAAGLGGGSSDAAAALRLARQALDLAIDDAGLARVARVIGADGPMCLLGHAAWAEGAGDILTVEPRLPPLAALLVNPGVPSSTAAVYHAYDAGPLQADDLPPPPDSWDSGGVIRWLAGRRNDLEVPAIELEPAIARALGETAMLDGVRLVRMSGSGATLFGLFDSAVEAQAAARALTALQPEWWVTPALLK